MPYAHPHPVPLPHEPRSHRCREGEGTIVASIESTGQENGKLFRERCYTVSIGTMARTGTDPVRADSPNSPSFRTAPRCWWCSRAARSCAMRLRRHRSAPTGSAGRNPKDRQIRGATGGVGIRDVRACVGPVLVRQTVAAEKRRERQPPGSRSGGRTSSPRQRR